MITARCLPLPSVFSLFSFRFPHSFLYTLYLYSFRCFSIFFLVDNDADNANDDDDYSPYSNYYPLLFLYLVIKSVTVLLNIILILCSYPMYAGLINLLPFLYMVGKRVSE